jgi:hypothetical protein
VTSAAREELVGDAVGDGQEGPDAAGAMIIPSVRKEPLEILAGLVVLVVGVIRQSPQVRLLDPGLLPDGLPVDRAGDEMGLDRRLPQDLQEPQAVCGLAGSRQRNDQVAAAASLLGSKSYRPIPSPGSRASPRASLLLTIGM